MNTEQVLTTFVEKLAAWSTFGLLVMTIALVVLNLFWIKAAHKQIQSSVPPSLEVTLLTTEFVIKNAGAVDICDIKGYPVIYILSSPSEIQSRNIPKGPAFELAELKSANSTVIPIDKVLNPKRPSSQIVDIAEGSPSPILAVIIQYRRSVDKKRFIHLEPYAISQRSLDKISVTNIAPICQSDAFSLRSEGSYIQGILKTIQDAEMLFFRSD